jgi:hypothetical protein
MNPGLFRLKTTFTIRLRIHAEARRSFSCCILREITEQSKLQNCNLNPGGIVIFSCVNRNIEHSTAKNND